MAFSMELPRMAARKAKESFFKWIRMAEITRSNIIFPGPTMMVACQYVDCLRPRMGRSMEQRPEAAPRTTALFSSLTPKKQISSLSSVSVAPEQMAGAPNQALQRLATDFYTVSRLMEDQTTLAQSSKSGRIVHPTRCSI